MALVESLLTAIVRADGDALVMHVGEKPYVVASAGPIELSTQGLNLQAMTGMTAQLLPADAQRALTEFGAVEHELPSKTEMQGDRFTVVVARGGDDVWIEIRRHRRPRPSASAVPVTTTAAAEPASPAPDPAAISPPAAPDDIPQTHAPVVASGEDTPDSARAPEPERIIAIPEPALAAPALAPVADVIAVAPDLEAVTDVEPEVAPQPSVTMPLEVVGAVVVPEPSEEAQATDASPHVTEMPEALAEHVEIVAAQPEPVAIEPEPMVAVVAPAAASPVEAHAAIAEPVIGFAQAAPSAVVRETGGHTPAPVIPLTRTLRIEVPPANTRQAAPRSDIERLLSAAAARGASALYMTTHASPYIRVDADMHALEGEPPLSAAGVEAAVLELMPEASRDALRQGEPTEWVSELADIGPVRCSTFRDHRGPGAIFQLISMRPMAAEQLGLAREIQALTTESEGLVLVASPRSNGKTTLVGSLVDLINRDRPVYVITLERQIQVVHDHHTALISQREVRGTVEQSVSIARAALRENPDVLVIEDLSSAEMLQTALDATGMGVLVIASVTAASVTAALARVVEFFPMEKRRSVQSLLAERLRGVIAQMLLRKIGGGRVAAREVLLPTAAITNVIASGQLSELPLAISTARKHGLVSLSDALVDLVRSGTVDLRDAYRKADDRDALVAALKRENVDPEFIERLA